MISQMTVESVDPEDKFEDQVEALFKDGDVIENEEDTSP